MAYSVDLSNEYLFVDGVVALTLGKRQADGTKVNTTIYGRRGMNSRAEYSGADFAESSHDAEWALWPGDSVVEVHDTINDGSTTWTITQQTDKRGDGSQIVVMATAQV